MAKKIGSKTLNVHVKYRDTLELGYITKPTNKHKFNDFISMQSKQIYFTGTQFNNSLVGGLFVRLLQQVCEIALL